MTAGQLRDRIQIQSATSGDDGYGNVITGWADLPGGRLWANVRETPGKEMLSAGRLESSRTATIRVRASSLSRSISAADRVIARGLAWNIRSVSAVGDGRELLELLCEASATT